MTSRNASYVCPASASDAHAAAVPARPHSTTIALRPSHGGSFRPSDVIDMADE